MELHTVTSDFRDGRAAFSRLFLWFLVNCLIKYLYEARYVS